MLSRRTPRPQPPARVAQRGITLVVVLILLVVVTVLGIAGARIALLGERSTRFDRDYQIAWESAEAALVDAEYDIDGPNTAAGNRMAIFTNTIGSHSNFVPNCGTSAAGTSPNLGLCEVSTGTTPIWRSVDWTNASGGTPVYVTFGTMTGRGTFQSGSGIQPALAPRYIIEQVPDKRSATSATAGAILYRITAIGFGPNVQTQVLMQSIYAKE